VLAARPEVANARNRVLGSRRRGVGPFFVGNGQQAVNLSGVETRQAEIEIGGAEFLQLQREKLFVPLGPGDRAIHHQSESPDLRGRPLVAEDDRDLSRVPTGPGAQLPRCLQPQVAIDDFAITAGEHRDLEAEFANRGAHAIHSGVVLPRVACVENEPINEPSLDLQQSHGRGHSDPSIASAGFSRQQTAFEGGTNQSSGEALSRMNQMCQPENGTRDLSTGLQ
jgi:hypothetical protein